MSEYSAEVRGGECGRIHQCKSAIQKARRFGGRQRNFTGENFWARGYFVSTVGLEENMVRAYIRNQEEEDERYEHDRGEWLYWPPDEFPASGANITPRGKDNPFES